MRTFVLDLQKLLHWTLSLRKVLGNKKSGLRAHSITEGEEASKDCGLWPKRKRVATGSVGPRFRYRKLVILLTAHNVATHESLESLKIVKRDRQTTWMRAVGGQKAHSTNMVFQLKSSNCQS